MGFLNSLFGPKQADPRHRMLPLYRQIVAKAREPHWYVDGGVSDSVDGRFEMVAAIMSLVLIRVEGNPAHKQDAVFLTELFVEDMDPQLREIGVGDMLVGKHIGKLMSALGGRMGTLRDVLAADGDFKDYILRNIYADQDVAVEKAEYLAKEIRTVAKHLAAQDTKALLSGAVNW
jgi:cytochrome b pre-mRNA-processing protein 3